MAELASTRREGATTSSLSADELKALAVEHCGDLPHDPTREKIRELYNCGNPELLAGLVLRYKGTPLGARVFLRGCGWTGPTMQGARDILDALSV